LEKGKPTDSILGKNCTATKTGIIIGIDSVSLEPGANAVEEYNEHLEMGLVGF
jgi:hypothetical protein